MARFSYDPLGRRVRKIAGGFTRKVAYDGEDILREKVIGVGNLRYIHGPGIDEPLGFEDITTAAMTYYHADGLGSIVKTTDSAGIVTLTRTYDSFGIPVLGADQPGYAYTGREWDPETGLYYYRARYYDPKVGRFVSEDSFRFAAGVNFYTYVLNNPVNLIDPTGHITLTCAQRIAREVGAEYCPKKGTGKRAPNDTSCAEAHCITNCRISRECGGGPFTAAAASYAKEFWDEFKQQTFDPTGAGYDRGDQAANKKGRICGTSPYTKGYDCELLCQGTR